MAIVKFNNRKGKTTVRKRKNLKRILEYVTDFQKTCKSMTGGHGVSWENAFERMNTVKKYYGKEGGREYIHFCVSLKGNHDSETVYQLAIAISYLFSEFQVLFALHFNTENIHIHFVVNSVSFWDGHKYSQSKYDMQQLKEKIENLIVKFGISIEDMILDDSDFYDDSDDYYYFEDEDEGATTDEEDFWKVQNNAPILRTGISTYPIPVPNGMDYIYATQMATLTYAILKMREKE